jgi:hypothetical protein
MVMQRFGRVWDNLAAKDDMPEIDAPIGQFCTRCGEPVAAGDSGVTMMTLDDDFSGCQRPMHHACFLRTFVGGVNHQRGTCFCCGGTDDPDPPGLTMRQAAELAAKEYLIYGFPRKKTELKGKNVPSME